jgi:hypothetical protein
MEKIDNIVFGDNQFFGINHMSQEKAQQLTERFHDINNIYSIYDTAFANGIKAVMLNSNDRAMEICNHFRANKSKYGNISWYPSIPYPHKYANLVAEKGIFPAINEVLFSNNNAIGVLGMIAKGGMALVGKDAIKMMQMLIDLEFRIFKGLDVKVLFLQNIIVDLLLGYDVKDVFIEYCEYVRKKYGVLPGFITQNLPYLLNKLKEWGIEEVVVCSSINKIGYLMSPSVGEYTKVITANDPGKYQLMAMSTLASGAIKADEAYSFINNLNIQSVVFGASSERNIRETVRLISGQTA